MNPFPFARYVCPRCRGSLVLEDESQLTCRPCSLAYPILGGIPDFILDNLALSPHVVLRRVKVFDWLARIYDWKPAYPLAVRIYAGWRVSHARVLRQIADMVAGVSGRIIDIACGPGTLGRLLADKTREFYGIDISLGMLRQGAALANHQGVDNVFFARALAERQPFPDACFDAALCGVALHLLAEPLRGLREIARTLKPGSPLVATTVIAGESGLFKFRAFREHMQKVHGLHTFNVPELAQLTAQADFQDFQAQIFGSLLAFRVFKPGKKSDKN
jgi:ubiquinone/menaquinone biosynthesis C-methylase UbiE